MLFYSISKHAKFRGIEDEDSIIAISCVIKQDEKDLTDKELSEKHRAWVSNQLSVPLIYIVSLSEEEYLKKSEEEDGK